MKFIVSTAMVAALLGLFAPTNAAAFDECSDDLEEATPITLKDIWEESAAIDPGLDIGEFGVAAADNELSAIDNERVPDLTIEAQGDTGRRARPGEERAMGFSARADILATSTWTLLDSGRSWARREAQSLRDEERAGATLFEHDFQALVAQSYVESAIAGEQWKLLKIFREDLDELAEVVDARVAEGVESRYEQTVLDDALANSNRMIAEAFHVYERSIIDLSTRVGHCARPAQVRTALGAIDEIESAAQHPSVILLRDQAETLQISSLRIVNEGTWQAGTRGVVGLYVSPAYDQTVEPEYYLGLFGLWRPDFTGVRRQRSRAQEQRSVALQAEADSTQRAREREIQTFLRLRDQAQERQELLDREREYVELRIDEARLRWSEGVGTWTDVLDATQRLQEIQNDELEFRRQIALAVLEYGIATGEMTQLPRWLGQ